MVIFQFAMSLPEGKSHEIPLNHHETTIFLWFSYGFTKLPEGITRRIASSSLISRISEGPLRTEQLLG